MGALFRFCAVAVMCVAVGANAQLDEPQSAFPPLQSWPPATAFDARDGLIKLDVAVTGKNGAPVAGLTEQDFTLLDNTQPQRLVTFAAFDGVKSLPDPAAQLIVVLDELHIDPENFRAVERALKRFLLMNGGQLEQPTSIYRISSRGLFASAQPTMNGPDLVKELESGKEPRAVRSVADLPRGFYCAAEVERKMNSADSTLGPIVLEQRRRPGRKVMIWIGPGWGTAAPPCSQGTSMQQPYEWVTEFSTRMREARIALYVLYPWEAPGWFDYAGYTGGVKRKEMRPGNLALLVLAANSGGQYVTDDNIEKAMERIAGYSRVFYTLTYDPPRAADVDEYHSLQVKAASPGAAVSTWAGYYDQPSFYDQQSAFEPITVAQLESRLEDLEAMRDAKAADQLSRLQLTERFSVTRLTEWEARLGRHEKTLQALAALADESMFLPLPAADIPQQPAPPLEEQRAMMARMVDYLTHTIPTLPDFFANRSILRYEENQPKDAPWKIFTGDGKLNASRVLSETVHYRNGREDVDETVSATIRNRKAEARLDAEGTFGAILNIVIPDAGRSELEWSRWEQTSRGLRAVFRFVVPSMKSHYYASYCCMTDMNGSGGMKWLTGYHGELMINPETGEILRLTLQADLTRLPLNRADLVVTFAPALIGDRTYLCPHRSVAITRGRTRMEIHEWGGSLETFGPFRTMLNDITYSQYRKFGTTMRILPGFVEAPE